MSDLTLKIGPVTLADFEIPERFGPLGGEQMTALHQFIGGRRVVQTFGPIPHMISWEGKLIGAAAFARARQLDRLRVDGSSQALVYGSWKFLGIVKRFEANAQHQFHVDYKIDVLTIEDQTESNSPAQITQNESLFRQAGLAVSQQIGLLQQYPGITGGATVQSLLPAPTLAGALSQVQGFMDTLRAAGNLFANMNPTTLAANIAGLALQSSAMSALAGEAGTSGAASALNAASAAEDLANQLRFMGFLAAQTTPLGSQPRVVYAVNPNLFVMSSTYYGDANKWTVIASANRFVDPQPRGKFRVLIPAV